MACVACGSRTELDVFPTEDAADAAPLGIGVDTSISTSEDSSCSACGDSDAGSGDATFEDADATDGSNGPDDGVVPFSSCLGDASALVIVDNVDRYYDTNPRRFEWVAWHQNPAYMDVELDDLPMTDQWSLVFATPVDAGPLSVGSYEDAVFSIQSRLPEMSIGGDGVGCDDTLGSFQVYALDLDDAGAVQTFGATFAQACIGASGGPLTLSGCVYVSR
jgi:hypothetical protein